jgi:hypothetical protein
MAKNTRALVKQDETTVTRRFVELAEKTNTQSPAEADVQALRQMLDQHPDLWRYAGDLANVAVQNLIHRLKAGPFLAESLKRGCKVIQNDLGYQAASPLERLLIDQVVLSWLHLNLVELHYTNATGQSITQDSADHWERRLSAAQRRHLYACEALARIRKLTVTTLALQVNIATHGGQQMNVITTPPAAD